jgi:retron-type reverse transcriptase
VYIEKEDGRQRPLAVPALEDKLVQQAVVTILNQIYEEDFLGFCVLQRYTDKEVMMT